MGTSRSCRKKVLEGKSPGAGQDAQTRGWTVSEAFGVSAARSPGWAGRAAPPLFAGERTPPLGGFRSHLPPPALCQGSPTSPVLPVRPSLSGCRDLVGRNGREEHRAEADDREQSWEHPIRSPGSRYPWPLGWVERFQRDLPMQKYVVIIDSIYIACTVL